MSSDEGSLGSRERWLLVLPLAGGLLFGAGPLLLGGGFGKLFGYRGDDVGMTRSGWRLSCR
jgi:hypothetical protein